MQVDTAVVFAGGKSSRMGEDKSKLPFGKYETLAQFQYEKLKKIFNTVYISTKENKFSFTDELIVEKDEGFAPTYGLLEVIKRLEKPFFALGVDIPFVLEDTIKRVVEIKGYDSVSIEIDGKLEPMCSVYYPSMKNYIEKSIDENSHRLTKILKDSNSYFLKLESSEEFINLNDKDTYQKALEMVD